MATTPTSGEGAKKPHNPTNRPTMADLCYLIADAVQREGTVTNGNCFMMDEPTAHTTLDAIADLATLAPCISINELSALMDSVHYYTKATFGTPQAYKAERAHEALTGLISLYTATVNRMPQLSALNTAMSQIV